MLRWTKIRSKTSLRAACTASLIENNELFRRHAAVESILAQQGLHFVDVKGDGNCFFRAVSYVTQGSEDGHSALRQLLATHIERGGCVLGGITNASPDDGKSFQDHLRGLREDGCPVGEDVIVALTAVYRRSVIVYIADAQPLVYPPLGEAASNVPIRLAFFEPGHYRAVVPDSGQRHLNDYRR